MSYCNRSDIEALFGAVNVKKWADLDNTEVEAPITARVATAIEYAQATIDDRLRGGRYTIPLAEPPPTTVVDTAARLAGFWLYDARGVQDFNEVTGQPISRLLGHYKKAIQTLTDIRRGTVRLPLTSKRTAPEVIPSD